MDINIWHQRMGHKHFESLVASHNKNQILGMELPVKCEVKYCVSCAEGKLHRKKVTFFEEKGEYLPGECLHWDRLTMPVHSRNGFFAQMASNKQQASSKQAASKQQQAASKQAGGQVGLSFT